MSKLKEIFGKDAGITIEDIDDAIKSGILYENDEIEFTDVDSFITQKKELSKDKRKNNRNIKIVSELISFLNSGQGRGVLILGLQEKNDEIIIKGVETLKNKEQIRTIVKNIGTIPDNPNAFKINTLPVSNEKKLFIVEVKNNDLDCLYYSKIDNNVYVRRGEEAKSLKMDEFLDLIAKKNHARIFLEINEKQDDSFFILDLILKNEGMEPGRYVTANFKVFSVPELNYFFEGKIEKQNEQIVDGTLTIGNEPLISFDENKIAIVSFKATAGYPHSSILIYPGLEGKIGSISIEKTKLKMVIDLDIYENKGKSEQTFKITANADEIFIEPLFRTYKSYLNI